MAAPFGFETAQDFKGEERINTPQCISLQFVFLPALDGVAEEYNARIHRPLEDLDVE